MSAATFGLSALLSAMGAEAVPTQAPTIEDAIRMVHIQASAAADGTVAAFAPDGSRLAAVVWYGDLARNVNVYSVLVFDVSQGRVGLPTVVLSRDFAARAEELNGSPIENLTFLHDNRTLVFVGQDGGHAEQVFSVDTVTRRVTQLTHHPTAVRSFVVGADGSLRMFSAVAEADGEADRLARLRGDGLFLWDARVFDQRTVAFKVYPALRMQPRLIRQYFLQAHGEPKLIFDSRESRSQAPLDLRDPEITRAPTLELHEEATIQGWATLSGDPTGKYALLFPYGLSNHSMQPERYAYYKTMNAYGRRVAAPYGLVDLATGRIERLVDAPHPQFDQLGGGGSPLWAPDGRSVIIYTLLPLERDSPHYRERSEALPQWCEVDIATRGLAPLKVPAGWRVVRWDGGGRALVLSKGSAFALFKRKKDNQWGDFVSLGTVSGFNARFDVATNGRLVIGVREALLTPPDLTAFDTTSRRTFALTDLNPELRHRRYGSPEILHWSHKYDAAASAFLIRPANHTPGVRYPLVVLLDDGTLGQEGEPFLLDAVLQLSGYAIQVLANSGFAVLYLREPPSLRRVVETPEEGEHMREHVESAVAELHRRGLVDRNRVGLSGWSRAGYHTNYVLIHSHMQFAAAAQIDGGGLEYSDGTRPFNDEELKCVRAPLLFEAHGLFSLVLSTAMADRLEALRKPTEVLYFSSASHQTTQPQHRLRSLGVHVDWWRFWLKDEEDSSSSKAEQYTHWRALRQLRPAQVQATASCPIEHARP